MNNSSMADLRPLSIGQLLDRAFRLYRNNFGVFIGIITITQIPVSIFSIAVSAFTVAEGSDVLSNPNSTADFERFADLFAPTAIFAIILVIVSAIFTLIGTATLTTSIADNYLGKKTSIMGAYRKVGRSWITLFGASFLAGIVMVAAFIPISFLFIIPCLGPIVGFIGFTTIGLIANAVTPLIAPVVILEKQTARQSLTRAWELAKLRFWWIVGYMFILSLMSSLITSGPTLLVSTLLTSTLGTSNPILSNVIQQMTSFLINILYLPLQLTAITLMYFDLRIRFEGFDLMVLAASVDETDIDVSDIDPFLPLDR